MATAPQPLASHPSFNAELQELEHLNDALEDAAEKQLAVIERLSAKPPVIHDDADQDELNEANAMVDARTRVVTEQGRTIQALRMVRDEQRED